MPYSIRFLFVVMLASGLGYGALWALAHFPPEAREVTKALSSDRLKP